MCPIWLLTLLTYVLVNAHLCKELKYMKISVAL